MVFELCLSVRVCSCWRQSSQLNAIWCKNQIQADFYKYNKIRNWCKTNDEMWKMWQELLDVGVVARMEEWMDGERRGPSDGPRQQAVVSPDRWGRCCAPFSGLSEAPLRRKFSWSLGLCPESKVVSTQWRVKAEARPPDENTSRTSRTRTPSRTEKPSGSPVPGRPVALWPALRSFTADTSWCRRPTATWRRAGGGAAARLSTTSTRWTGAGARRTGTGPSAPGASASTRLSPACSTACLWPTGASTLISTISFHCDSGTIKNLTIEIHFILCINIPVGLILNEYTFNLNRGSLTDINVALLLIFSFFLDALSYFTLLSNSLKTGNWTLTLVSNAVWNKVSLWKRVFSKSLPVSFKWI